MKFLPYDYWYEMPNISIGNNETHIWYIDLNITDDKAKDFILYLDDSEKERAARFHFDHHRRQFILSHAVMRKLIAMYLDMEPLELEFSQGKYGKPQVKGLQFNLSHSQEKALLAVNKSDILGVDIEYMKDSVSFESIAERYFASSEVDELSQIPTEKKKLAFFQGWTRKEAYVKAIGDGLTMPLADFSIPLLATENLTIKHNNAIQEKDWAIWNIDVGLNYAAAIVVATENTQFKKFLM